MSWKVLFENPLLVTELAVATILYESVNRCVPHHVPKDVFQCPKDTQFTVYLATTENGTSVIVLLYRRLRGDSATARNG
jgi:hypothetical protein